MNMHPNPTASSAGDTVLTNVAEVNKIDSPNLCQGDLAISSFVTRNWSKEAVCGSGNSLACPSADDPTQVLFQSPNTTNSSFAIDRSVSGASNSNTAMEVPCNFPNVDYWPTNEMESIVLSALQSALMDFSPSRGDPGPCAYAPIPPAPLDFPADSSSVSGTFDNVKPPLLKCDDDQNMEDAAILLRCSSCGVPFNCGTRVCDCSASGPKTVQLHQVDNMSDTSDEDSEDCAPGGIKPKGEDSPGKRKLSPGKTLPRKKTRTQQLSPETVINTLEDTSDSLGYRLRPRRPNSEMVSKILKSSRTRTKQAAPPRRGRRRSRTRGGKVRKGRGGRGRSRKTKSSRARGDMTRCKECGRLMPKTGWMTMLGRAIMRAFTIGDRPFCGTCWRKQPGNKRRAPLRKRPQSPQRRRRSARQSRYSSASEHSQLGQDSKGQKTSKPSTSKRDTLLDRRDGSP